jgi:murein DD-endopeptidase MepM/ murein hydrolase activator NlpD
MLIDPTTLPIPTAPLGMDDPKRLAGKPVKDVAREFEVMLLAQVIGEMRKTVGDSGLLEKSPDRRVLDGAFDVEVARSLSAHSDFGVARQITAQLGKRAGAPPAQAEASAPAAAAEAKPKADAHADALQPTPATDGVVSPVDGRLSSAFGPRRDPITGEPQFHGGVDLAAPQGSDVRAATGGEVIYSGRRERAGNVVEVRRGDVVMSYAHLDQVLVGAGQTVSAGDVLATVGSTGRTTGPHLHFAVSRDGKALDPALVLAGSEQPGGPRRGDVQGG